MDTNLSIGLMAVMYGVMDHLRKSKTPSLLVPLFEQAIDMTQTLINKADDCWQLAQESKSLREQLDAQQRYHNERSEKAHKAAKYVVYHLPRKVFADLLADGMNKISGPDTATVTGQYLVDVAHLDQLDRACEMFIAGNAIECIKGLRGAFVWDLRKAKENYEAMMDQLP